MPSGSIQNGRNDVRHHLRNLTNQHLVDKIIENRIGPSDSRWTPEQSPTQIRNDIFEQAKVFASHHRNGKAGGGGGGGGTHELTTEPFLGSSNGCWEPSSQTTSNMDWRSGSPSTELMRLFGSQTIDSAVQYGDISLYRIGSRTTQTSPINLSMSSPDVAPLNLTNSRSVDYTERCDDSRDGLSSSDGSGSSSDGTTTAVSNGRTNMDEGTESAQSHWKKIMVSNITQQERQ